MSHTAVYDEERRISPRKRSPDNLHIYCPQLNISHGKPLNLTTRGAYLDLIPDHAYVGRRVQIVFSISEGKTVRLIRVWAVVVHLSNDGIGFGFTSKYRTRKQANEQSRVKLS